MKLFDQIVGGLSYDLLRQFQCLRIYGNITQVFDVREVWRFVMKLLRRTQTVKEK